MEAVEGKYTQTGFDVWPQTIARHLTPATLFVNTISSRRATEESRPIVGQSSSTEVLKHPS